MMIHTFKVILSIFKLDLTLKYNKVYLEAEEPGGLPSMGSHRVGHDWRDLAAAAAEAL